MAVLYQYQTYFTVDSVRSINLIQTADDQILSPAPVLQAFSHTVL